jgi:Uma2 family endonuclease
MSAVIAPSLRKITAAEYHQMGKAGILRPDERVELLDGKIIKMAPIGSRHASTVNRLAHFFIELLAAIAPNQVIVSTQNPLRLSNFSEPQPDLCLLRYRSDFYSSRSVEPSDVLLLIEVSDSSLRFDRKVKIPLYAASSVAEVWIVDLDLPAIEVFDSLSQDRSKPAYTRQRVCSGQQRIELGLLPQVSLAVAQVLSHL